MKEKLTASSLCVWGARYIGVRLGFCCMLLSIPTLQADTIAVFGTLGPFNASGHLGALDLDTGMFTIGSVVSPQAASVDDLAYSGATLYGLVAPSNGSPNLVTLNSRTGAATVIANGVTVSSIAFNPSGALYGTDGISLYRLNAQTGLATLIGSLGLPPGAGVYNMRFDPAGNLYVTEGQPASITNLGRVNTSTGQFSLIGSTGLPAATLDVAAATFYGTSQVYVNGQDVGTNLITINPSTGVGTIVATGLPMAGIDFALAPGSLQSAPFFPTAIGSSGHHLHGRPQRSLV